MHAEIPNTPSKGDMLCIFDSPWSDRAIKAAASQTSNTLRSLQGRLLTPLNNPVGIVGLTSWVLLTSLLKPDERDDSG
jgi:hypothetical protein